MQLLSSIYGKIESLLLSFPGLVTPDSDRQYRDLIAKLEPERIVTKFSVNDPTFEITCSKVDYRSPAKQRLSANDSLGNVRKVEDLAPQLHIGTLLKNWQRQLKPVMEEGRPLVFNEWVQDPFSVVQDETNTALIFPFYNASAANFMLPFQLTEMENLRIFLRPTTLHLEGGNILKVGEKIIIGRDLIVRNQNVQESSAAEVVQAFAELLGGDLEDIIVFGYPEERHLLLDRNRTSFQPFFHVDLHLSPGGKHRSTGKELLFWGDPLLAIKSLSSTGESWAELAQNQKIRARLSALDDLKSIFPSEYFHLESLPLFLARQCCFSWNNCLVEEYLEGGQVVKRAFLPSYLCAGNGNDVEKLNPEFELLEAQVQQIYERNGFRVTWIESGRFFRDLVLRRGSLHCVTKVLRRSAYSI
ncbi:MAG: hypothetical protein AAF998_02105 [Bacteroidota bacterium]